MHDDQFTATGPPFTGSGFERTGFSTDSEGGGFQFGVRANAARCGVVGQTGGGGIAGVCGQGRFSKFGVLGTGFDQSIGIVGVSVTNTNDLFNLNVPPGDFDLNSLGDGRGTGVLGKSAHGFGLHGVSQDNTAVVGSSDTGFGVHGISKSNTAVVGSSDSGIGVHGIVNGAGDGLRGSSTNGNGGVFESQQAAQIRLIPKNLTSPEGQINGNGGELVVTTSSGESGPTFGLWFCARGGDTTSTVWELVAGTRPFPGTPIAEGADGITVKRIQLQLNLVAAAGLVVDGDFGPLTKQAVIDFQNVQQIERDGIVGPVTWGKLFAVV